ncbi:MAG: phenylalanine--tRNA ligase subunit beta, partial [Pseudomonadota bacterium]
MKFSESWLRSLVNPACTTDELAHRLTMAGLEVEECLSVAPDFQQVVVAQVIAVNKHPSADRLNICQVDTGRGALEQIVCGAPNVTPGIKVPCALPGALLPQNMHIKATEIRGVKSAGMLCSAAELGIDGETAGLLLLANDAPVGENIRHHLDLDDRMLTLKLTPNRADCLSLWGIAREVAALTNSLAQAPQFAEAPITHTQVRTILVHTPDACPRYTGRVILGVNAKAATPAWMKRRLLRSGLRSISALVDISNYVMLELGQPLHVFDNSKITGSIHVRLAQDSASNSANGSCEELLLLNEQNLKLGQDVLLIADDQRPLAMAGIMGGKDSAVSLETTDLFLEAAFFTPTAIAGRARRHGFTSDAAHRFERGVDFSATRHALERTTQLILELCGGAAGPVSEALNALPTRAAVRLRPARLARVLGIHLSQHDIEALLSRLAFQFVRDADDFIVTVPNYRFDIAIEEDLIEELIRLHGYDNIPVAQAQARLSMSPVSEQKRTLSEIRQNLVSLGFQEVINFSFVAEAWEKDFAANSDSSGMIRLANPIASQLNVMRSNLLGGLLDNLATNLKRKLGRIRIFESGRCFLRKTESAHPRAEDLSERFHQPWRVAALAYGGAAPEQWGQATRTVDFFDLKGDLENLLAPQHPFFNKTTHPALHPGRSAEVFLQGKSIGFIGELHPKWVQKYEFPLAPIVFELDLHVLTQAQLPCYQAISSQPPVIRDLALIVDQKIELQSLLSSMLQNRSPLIQDITLFDVYVGKGIEPGLSLEALGVSGL